MTTINIEFLEGTSETRYLDACANIRGITKTRLLRNLMEVIMKDQMVEAILDDADDLDGAKAKKAKARSHTTKAPVLPSSMPHARPTTYYGASKRKYQPTKAELREQLTQAVVNTGGQRIMRENRKEMLLERIRLKGRLCPSDLGSKEEQQRWQLAFVDLLQEGKIYKNAPEEYTRRVYYELCPSTGEAVSTPAVSEQSSPDVSAGGDLEGNNGIEDIPSFLPSRADA